jgi:MFS family permease
MQRRTRLPATVIALGFVSLLTDASSEMIYPLLPAFLTTVLGAGAVALGTIEGLAETTAAVVKILSGRRTDRTGKRKPLVVGGYSISGLTRPLIGFASVWPAVALFRFVDRVGKGIRTSPRDALIADSVPAEDRGRAYGFHRAMDHAGSVVGPLVAALLLSALGLSLRQVIWLAIVPAIGVILVLVWAVHEPEQSEPKIETRAEPAGRLPKPFRSLVVAVVVFTLGNSTDAFFLLRFTDVGIPVAGVAVLWAAHSSVKMVTTWVGGRAADAVGRKPLVLSGWILYAAIYVGFGLVASKATLIVLFLVYGVTFGLTEPAERAWVADLAPRERRGSAFGWYYGAVGIAALPASILFGAVYDLAGPAAAFGVGGGLALVASSLLLRVRSGTGPDLSAAPV